MLRAQREARAKNPGAKATKGKTGMAEVQDLVRRSSAGTGLRVGAADADQPQRGRGRPKIDGPREWEKEGISRAEWYRRQAEKRDAGSKK